MPSPPQSRPLKIGFLIDRWNPQRGGAERALATFAAYLEARGHEIFAFGLEGPPPGVSAPGLFIPVRTHGWTRSTRERHLADRLIESARAMHCDLTVGVRHLREVDMYWPHGGAHAATLKALGKRGRGRHRAFLQLEQSAVADGGARRVICVSELVRQELLDFYPTCAPRLRVVPNGLDLEVFHVGTRESARKDLLELADWQDGPPVLTFIARNPKLKGLPVLLKALKRLEQRPWRLVISGPRKQRRLAKRLRRLFKDPSRCHLTEELDPLLAAAGSDLLVLPSRRDTCGLVVLEALATGTPVLVSEAVGAKEVITDAEIGAVLGVRPKAAHLAAHIESRLERIENGDVPRDRIANSVAGRGLADWMGALEHELLDIAR